MNIALVLSGGTGSRMRTEVPKQYLEIAGKPVLVHTMEQFQRCSEIDGMIVVAAGCWIEQISQWKNEFGFTKLLRIALAGADRQQSILSGLLAAEPFMPGGEDNVIIQDAVRPLTSVRLIEQLLLGLQEAPCVMPVLPVTDTIYTSTDGQWTDGLLERSTLFAGQAPEAFHYWEYLKLYKETSAEELSRMSGSCQLPQSKGWKVKMIPGERENIKITVPLDWQICERILEERGG